MKEHKYCNNNVLYAEWIILLHIIDLLLLMHEQHFNIVDDLDYLFDS